MAIDSLAIFKSTYNALPSVIDGSWTTTVSDWLDARVTSKAKIAQVTHATTPFTFSKSTFKAQLDLLSITLDKGVAVAAFANAWRLAVDSSVYATIAGDYVNPPPPITTNTWSVVSSSIIDVASRTAAENQMITDLNNASNVLDPNNSEIPKILRDAFLNLTISITGFDQTPPPAGPIPLNVTGASLL